MKRWLVPLFRVFLYLLVLRWVFPFFLRFVRSHYSLLSVIQVSFEPTKIAFFLKILEIVVVILLTWTFLRWWDKKKLGSLGLQFPHRWWVKIPLGLILPLFLIGSIFFIGWLGGWLIVDGFAWEGRTTIDVFHGILNEALLLLLSSISAEIIFRGYILQSLRRSWGENGGTPIAVIVSSLIFTITHASIPGISLLGYFTIYFQGVFFCLAYLYTRSLWMPIAIHFSWNFFLGPVFSMPVSGIDAGGLLITRLSGSHKIITGGSFGLEGSIVGIGVVWLGIILYIVSLTIPKKIAVWRFSKIWRDFCSPQYMAKDSAMIKGLRALEKNNRKKARKIWETLQKYFPKDYRITHSLALLNYWETVSARNPKSFHNKVIEKTIGNWVMLLNSDLFWETWRKDRQPFYFQGNIPKEQIEELRRSLRAELENKISDDYQNALLLESKTSELLRSIADWGQRKGLNPKIFIAGPIMLKELDMLKRARRLVLLGLQVDPENNEFKLLSLYLSPLGIVTLLLREEKVEDALNKLGRTENRNRCLTEEFKEEFANATLKWINQAPNDKELIERCQRALNVCPSERLKLFLSNKYQSKANELAIQPNPNWNGICDLLEKALKLQPDDESLKREVALAYCYSVWEEMKKKQRNWLNKLLIKIRRVEETIKKLKIHYESIDNNIANIFNTIGVELANQGRYWKSRHLLKKAIKYDPRNGAIQKNIKAVRKVLFWRVVNPCLMPLKIVIPGALVGISLSSIGFVLSYWNVLKYAGNFVPGILVGGLLIVLLSLLLPVWLLGATQAYSGIVVTLWKFFRGKPIIASLLGLAILPFAWIIYLVLSFLVLGSNVTNLKNSFTKAILSLGINTVPVRLFSILYLWLAMSFISSLSFWLKNALHLSDWNALLAPIMGMYLGLVLALCLFRYEEES